MLQLVQVSLLLLYFYAIFATHIPNKQSVTTLRLSEVRGNNAGGSTPPPAPKHNNLFNNSSSSAASAISNASQPVPDTPNYPAPAIRKHAGNSAGRGVRFAAAAVAEAEKSRKPAMLPPMKSHYKIRLNSMTMGKHEDTPALHPNSIYEWPANLDVGQTQVKSVSDPDETPSEQILGASSKEKLYWPAPKIPGPESISIINNKMQTLDTFVFMNSCQSRTFSHGLDSPASKSITLSRPVSVKQAVRKCAEFALSPATSVDTQLEWHSFEVKQRKTDYLCTVFKTLPSRTECEDAFPDESAVGSYLYKADIRRSYEEGQIEDCRSCSIQ